MMKFLGHVLALLLATTIVVAVWGFVLGRTLGSASYLEHQASQAQLYERLGTAVPEAAIDPADLANRVNAVLPGFIDHLTKGTPAPTFALPGGDSQTLTLGGADEQVTDAFAVLRPAAMSAPFVALALVLLIIGVMRARRLLVLSRAGLQAAISLAASAALLWFAPSLILSLLDKPDTAAIRPVIAPFLESVLHGIATQLAAAALALLIITIALRLVHSAGLLKNRFIKPKPPAKPQIPPAPGSVRN
ncbi:MAG TPA: hypothetical protein VMT30_04630 [Candidatus Saccharimonadia bacterium]|nr:hypothetical protein [Candidatus Saccharimonadia bacterium]